MPLCLPSYAMDTTMREKVITFMLQTGFTTQIRGLVVNPSFPWLGASPDAVVIDPSVSSVGMLEIKCPYARRLSTVEEATSDLNLLQRCTMVKSL